MTLDEVEQERADPTGLAARPAERLSLCPLTRVRAHAGQVGAVMMAVAVMVTLVCVWWIVSGGW